MLPGPVGAQTTVVFREDGNFTHLITAAEYYQKHNNSYTAAHYYRLALKEATTDAERAQAYLGVGKHTPVRYGAPNPTTDGVDKLKAYQQVLDLAEAPPNARIDARFGKAETEVSLGRYEDALASLQPLSTLPELTPEQKRRMQLWVGQILGEVKRYDEARARLNEVLASPEASIADKHAAHKAIARSHLAQTNLPSALAEIDKINALPGLTDVQRADIHFSNADLLTQNKNYQAARDELGKIAVLADVPNDKLLMARIKIGESHYHDKEYAKAREVWAQVLDMRAGNAHAKDIWRLVGVSHSEEKEYAKAREAYQKWLAVPGIDLKTKVAAWQYIAYTYVQEKNYAAARDALSNIDKGSFPTTYDGSALYLRKQLDLADVYLAEGDNAQAVAAFESALFHIKNFTSFIAGMKPPDHYEVPKQIKQAAEKLAKEAATRDAAYTIFAALERFHPYELQKAEALLAMGDILVALNKKTEARAMFQKAYELRKNFNEGKLAQQKLQALDGGQPAG